MPKNKNINIAKFCLLIGINYKDSDAELSGCINDSQNLKQFLIQKNYFDNKEIIMMNDNKSGVLYPTKRNILKMLDNMRDFALKNQNKKVLLFFAYSGHGHNIRDENGDEIDGRDEVLCPVDFSQNGFIVDDLLKSRFVDKLPANTKLVTLIDACHSGTMLDLKYNYAIDRLNTMTVYGKIKQTTCEVVMISGCRDDQTSADAYILDRKEGRYEYQGAMTAAFINNYDPRKHCDTLINDMREWLKDNRFSQVPQLSSGRYIDVEDQLLLSSFNKN